MFVFEYDHTDYKALAQAMAKALGVTIKNNRLQYPPEVALGYMQTIEMQGGLQAMAFDYTFTDTYRLKRKKIKEEFYTLWFMEVDIDSDVQVELDNDRYRVNNSSFSTALLTSSLFDANYELSPGTRTRGTSAVPEVAAIIACTAEKSMAPCSMSMMIQSKPDRAMD